MHKIKILRTNISKIKELHHMQVEIIIHSLKQNNLNISHPSNMQIISQEQLNVDIFPVMDNLFLGAPTHPRGPFAPPPVFPGEDTLGALSPARQMPGWPFAQGESCP